MPLKETLLKYDIELDDNQIQQLNTCLLYTSDAADE